MAAMATKPAFETRWHYWEDDSVPGCPFTVGFDYGRFTNNAVYSWPTEELAKLFVSVASIAGRNAAFAATEKAWKETN